MAIRKAAYAVALMIALTLVGSGIASAASQFTDVPDTHVFHDDIAWLADLGITKGCNPPTNDQYCPGDPVSRGQMAAFLHRFGNVPIETKIAIDQFGFTPVRDNHTFLDYDYNAVGNLGRSSGDLLGASVPVPDGATITGFSATFCDSTAAGNYRAQLIRRPDPAVVDAPDEVIAVATSTGNACAVTASTTSISEPVVDTASYSYAILVSDDGGSGGVNIRRATVTYERPLVP